MTRLGKFLVFFNLAFALVLAAWTFGQYANGIDWTDRKDKNVPVGEFAIHGAKLEEAWKGVDPAQASWLRQRFRLDNEYKALVAERTWYDQELRHVYVGNSKNKPLRQVTLENGQIVLDQQGLPQMGPVLDTANKPLQLHTLVEYNQEDDQVLKSLQSVMQEHEKNIEQANRLTDLIIGDKAKGMRGLQDRINDEKVKDADLKVEQKAIELLLINTVVEAQLITKRHQQLERRIEELHKWKVASK